MVCPIRIGAGLEQKSDGLGNFCIHQASRRQEKARLSGTSAVKPVNDSVQPKAKSDVCRRKEEAVENLEDSVK
jgi:hypothetical protein